MISPIARDFAISSRQIVTMNASREVLDGYLVVRAGTITDVLPRGSELSATMPVMNLDDKVLLPGFVDPHMHFSTTAAALWGAVDCHAPHCESISDIQAALRDNAHLRDTRGGWLVGQSGLFTEQKLKDRRLPNRNDLDLVSTEFPIVIRFGGHVTAVNTAALELGIDAGLPTSGDAYMELDSSGSPTGILHEMFYSLPIPSIPENDFDDAIDQMVQDNITRYGTTTIGEMFASAGELEAIAARSVAGRIPLRIEAFLRIADAQPQDIQSARAIEFSETDEFRLRGIKIFIDGGFSAQGAAILGEYRASRDGQPNQGRIGYSRGRLTGLVRACGDNEFQLAAHVNGERAQVLLCEAAAAAREGAAGYTPVRLEHAGNLLTSPATMESWRSAEATPIPQATFLWTMGESIEESIELEGPEALFPFRTLFENGWDISSSSDGTGSEPRQFNSLFGVEIAVTRASWSGRSLSPDQAVSRMDALAMHTINAAKAMGLEDRVGSLEVGKHADFLVAADSPLRVAPADISHIEVEEVFLGGVPVK